MKKLLLIGIIFILIISIIAWYLISPLFIDKKVNEEFPIEKEDKKMNEFMEEDFEITFSGDFKNADSFHKTSGMAKIINTGDSTYLRLEDFETTNGPDLYVYLAKDIKANDFISLGRLKGNLGNQNYEINSDIDTMEYNKVLIWCRQFNQLFGSAQLN